MSPTFINNTIHFYFEKDDQPGLHVWTNEHDPTTNEFVYMPVDIPFLTREQEHLTNDSEGMQCMNFPNPFSEFTHLIFNSPENGIMKLSIYNSKGQIMRNSKHSCNIGLNKLIFRSKNLDPGIYFYTIMLDDDTLWEDDC